MTTVSNRREVLRSLLAGGAIMAAPGLSRAVWASTGSGQGTLKLVFYSDVHARVEWDTPDALAMAAEHMNAHKADLVIGGGDLITEGFESSAATARPRWDAYMTMHNALRGELHTAIGNHDLVAAIPEDGTEPATDPRSVFRERIGVSRTYYSFDALGYHFVSAGLHPDPRPKDEIPGNDRTGANGLAATGSGPDP